MGINDISGAVIDSAMRVHSELGPGLLESTYEACLKYELVNAGLTVVSQLELPIQYKGVEIDTGYRLDLLVEDQVIVELKAIDKLLAIHEAQLLSYLKLSKRKVGLLINFNVPRLKHGIKRLIH